MIGLHIQHVLAGYIGVSYRSEYFAISAHNFMINSACLILIFTKTNPLPYVVQAACKLI